jgi:hypothetical protein
MRSCISGSRIGATGELKPDMSLRADMRLQIGDIRRPAEKFSRRTRTLAVQFRPSG